MDILANYHRVPRYLKNRIKENKYIFVIEVDPQFDLDQETNF